MGGRSNSRNPVSPEKNAPTDWHVGSRREMPRNVRWSAKLSGNAVGGPVVASGLIWVGASNIEPHDPAILGDRGVLACFREADGKFLYQYTVPRLDWRTNDWPMNGISGSPVAEGDRLWFLTNRREVVCLDVAPLRQRGEAPRELWKYDLLAEQSVVPDSPMLHSHNTLGSLAVHGDLLFVPTGNGVAVDHPGANKIKAPQAPSLLCLRKNSGELVWKDNSAERLGYGGHHASPLVVEVGGQVQVVHPQADGWVRSFQAETGKLLWKFDTNPKGAKWDWLAAEENQKCTVTATPVVAEGRIYFAAGRDLEFSGKRGRLFCLDPSKRGDISPELDDGQGGSKQNPNSGLIWDFTKDGEDDSPRMHQTLASVAVADGLAVVPDLSGWVHCFDAATGQRHWSYDTAAPIYGDPLIVDGKIYVGDELDVTILALSKRVELLATHELNNAIFAPPVFANGVLYLQTDSHLYAIAKH